VIEHHEIEPRPFFRPESDTPLALESAPGYGQSPRRRRKLGIAVTVAVVVAIGLVIGIVMGVRASLGHDSG